MKARPRSIEREVAALLTEFSVSCVGKSPVYRIPVLGRTGPDLTINELNLVVDVKSRKVVPKGILLAANAGLAVTSDHLLVCRLDQIGELFIGTQPTHTLPASKLVRDYWEHMHEWKTANRPEGITTLVLHRPGTIIRGASVVIHESERSMLWKMD